MARTILAAADQILELGAMDDRRLSASDGSDDQIRLGAGYHEVWQRGIGRFVREIFLAGEKAQKWPALLRQVVAYRAAQHGIMCFERVEHRTLRHRALNFKRDLAADARQRSQMRRQHHVDRVDHSRLRQRLNFHRKHGRKIAHDRRPTVSGIGRSIHLPARGAEIDAARIEGIDGHGIAQHVDVAIVLREPLRERLPFIASGAATVDAKLGIGDKMF